MKALDKFEQRKEMGGKLNKWKEKSGQIETCIKRCALTSGLQVSQRPFAEYMELHPFWRIHSLPKGSRASEAPWPLCLVMIKMIDKDYDDDEDRMQKTIVIWARLWVWVNRWVEGCDDDKIRYMIRIMANIGHNGLVFVARKKSRTCARLLFAPHRRRHPAKVSFRFFRSSQITLRVARWQ